MGDDTSGLTREQWAKLALLEARAARARWAMGNPPRLPSLHAPNASRYALDTHTEDDDDEG
jgi:hypothetical protein